MKRINFHIPKEMLAALKKRQQQTGVAVAEQIRRAIKAKLDREKINVSKP